MSCVSIFCFSRFQIVQVVSTEDVPILWGLTLLQSKEVRGGKWPLCPCCVRGLANLAASFTWPSSSFQTFSVVLDDASRSGLLRVLSQPSSGLHINFVGGNGCSTSAVASKQFVSSLSSMTWMRLASCSMQLPTANRKRGSGRADHARE
eukprot:CAMPEP_0180612332 /NCGR_PEP_ID=MMETSP1037_2-20121125/30307_1 /TAXON_ID=632150 /ORGANISM="Azadinium spinosum, Strain 3D9" /LENGTH=148 /DNA_ID=CAMNT_0022631931 /DNA_START=770 /DNA_END=1216 /DNA_ORIENTATION=-